MARNRLAGARNGTSRTARFYQENPEAREKHNEYNSKRQRNGYKKSSALKLYKAKLKKINNSNPNSKVGDGKDVSHTKNGLVLKNQSVNRGSKSDSAGDRRARGKKK
jgi:hypothetical protein